MKNNFFKKKGIRRSKKRSLVDGDILEIIENIFSPCLSSSLCVMIYGMGSHGLPSVFNLRSSNKLFQTFACPSLDATHECELFMLIMTLSSISFSHLSKMSDLLFPQSVSQTFRLPFPD